MVPRFTILLLCLSVIFTKLTAQGGLTLQEAASCDAAVQEFLQEWEIPGANIAIAKDGQLFYSRGLGVIDEESEQQVQPYHRFRIAGLSKTITAAAILKLVEDEKLSLDDKVFGLDGVFKMGVLLEFILKDDRIFDITVRHLLEHSAGWDASVECPPYSEDGCDPIFFPLEVEKATYGPNPVNTTNIISFALQQGLQFDPGTDFAYSNVGYLLLGEIVARVSGMSYEKYVQTQLLDPLGICDMTIGRTLLEDRQERESFYHTTKTALSAFGTGETVSAAYGQFHLEALTASNGIVSTAEELLRFVLGIDGFDTAPDILSPETIDVLSTAGANNPNYAKGIQVDEAGNWWHQGSLPGSSTVWGRTSDGYAWVALFNKDTLLNAEAGSSISNEFNDLILKCIEQLPEDYSPSANILDRPTQPADEIQALVIKETSMVLSWTKGEGAGQLLLMKEGGPVNVFPQDGETYEVGDDLGDGTMVAYKGDAAAVNLKDLASNTNYHFRLIDFNEVKVGEENEEVYQVGCSPAADFTTLPLESDCKCLTNRMDDICEDFESFFTDLPIGLQSNCWTTKEGPEGNPLDALITTDTAFNGTQSLLINGKGNKNVVFTLSDRKEGRYAVRWKMLVPENKKGNFSIQQSQSSAGGVNLEVSLGSTGMVEGLVNMTVDLSGTSGIGADALQKLGGGFILPEDEWFTVSQIIDLDNNTLDLMIGEDVVVSDFTYDGDLGGINFFSEGENSRFFIDALEVETLSDTSLEGDLPNLTCSSSGTLTIEDDLLLIEDLEVSNNGEGFAPGSSIGFFLSDNTSFTTLDTYIGENSINGLDPEESIQITFGADISQLDLPPGEYFVGFIIDYKNVVTELDEEDNNDCFFLQPKVIILPPPMPDLACRDEGVVTVEEDSVKIANLEVANLGAADSDSTDVAFYLTPNDNVTTFDIEIGTAKLAPIPAGDSLTINFSAEIGSLDLAADDYKVGYILDYTEVQEEENEENNNCLYASPLISFPLGDPNLACDSLGSLTIDGSVVDINELRYINDGDGGAGSHTVGIYLSTNTNFTTFDELIGEIDVDTLPPGATLTFSSTIDVSGLGLDDGTYFVGVILDKDEEVAETDEEDNNDCFYIDPTITLPFVPNLTCASLGTLTLEGAVIEISDLEVTNDGIGGAGSHTIGIYLSSDTSITTEDELIGEVDVDTLPAGGIATLSATIDVTGLDIPEGEYYVGIFIDKNEEVAETDEEDNDCSYQEETIALPVGDPNLACAELGTLTVEDGVVDIADLKVTNNGPVGAGSHTIGVYLSTNTNFTASDELIGEIDVDTLGAGDTLSIDFTVDVSAAGIPDGAYFVGIIQDTGEEVAESDEDDNNDCFFLDPTITLPVFGDPDLTCNDSGTLTVDGSQVMIEDLEVLNTGEGPAGSSFVGFYLSTNTTFTELDHFIGEAAVEALDMGESAIISFEVDLDTLDLPAGEYFVGYILDYKDEVSEILETNNANCYFVTPKVTIETPLPNLICEDLGTFTITGDGFVLDVDDFKLSNIGVGAAAGSTLGFYLSSDTDITTDDYKLGDVFIASVPSEGIVTVDFSADISGLDIDPGSYFFGFILDEGEAIAETNEDDNSCYYDAPKVEIPSDGPPNLVCGDLGTATIDDDFILNLKDIEVTNNGDGPAGASTLAIYLSENTTITSFDNLILEIPIDGLNPGEVATVDGQVDLKTLSITTGSYFIGLYIDNDGDVEESNESDNNDCYYTTPKVSFPLEGQPNLSCKDAGLLEIDGTEITITDFEVINSGNETAGASSIGFYLSTDQNFTTDDELIGAIDLGNIPAGATVQGSFLTTVNPADIPDGTYMVGFIIDYLDEVDEQFEGDNRCGFKNPTITLPLPDQPDLTCKEIGTIYCDDWDIFLRDIWIQNIGDGKSGETTVCVYLSPDSDFEDNDNILIEEIDLAELEDGGTAGLSANIELMNLDVPYGTYHIALVIDCKDKVAESNEDNNICIYDKVIKLDDPKKPDLVCKYRGDLIIDDWDIFIKDLKVKNIGDKKSGETYVCVVLSEDKIFNKDDLEVKKIYLPALNPGQIVELTANIELMGLDVPYGSYYVGIIIDCDDKVDEYDDVNNNICYWDIVLELEDPKKPDLTCQEIGTIYCDDWDIFLRDIWIKNIGQGASEATEVCVYLSEDNDFEDEDNILIETIPLSALDGGETDGLSANIELMNLDIPYGTYYVALVIDCEDKVMESDEDNNICIYDKVLELEEPKKPDLTCKYLGSFKLGSTGVAEDMMLTIEDVIITNIGDAKSDPAKVAFYLSENNKITTNDLFLGEVDIDMLDPDEVVEINFQADLEGLGVPYGEYYVGLIIDSGEEVDEADESNNTCHFSETLKLLEPGEPDLTCMQLGELTIDKDWNLAIRNLKIINNGTAKSGVSRVGIYLSTNTTITKGDFFLGSIVLKMLEPGQTAWLTFDAMLEYLDIPPGAYYVGIIIDDEMVVDESDEGNNTCYYDWPKVKLDKKKADLTCKESGTIECDDWDIYIKDAWIQNTGDMATEATTVCVYLSKDNDFEDNDNILIETLPLGALDPGETAGITENIELANFMDIVPPGTYYVGIVIDCDDEVMESNEYNNICYYNKTITLESPKKPDLTCKESGTIECDDWDIYIKDAWIQNTGDMATEATTVCVYLSKDNDFEDNDNILIETLPLGALDPGETAGITENIELANFMDIVPPGTYYVGIVIDCDDEVMESNEYNNICYYNKTITLESPKKPDLTCKEPGWIYCDDWDLYLRNAWIQNIGGAESEQTTVCIYLSPDQDFDDEDNLLVKEVPIPSLDPGQTFGVDANIELMGLDVPPGTYYVGLVIDCDDKVEESDEYNNVCYFSKTITLEIDKKPDLLCKENGYLWYDDWDLAINNIWIGNMGDAPSEQTSVCVYISKDSDFTDGDNILLKSVDLEAIEAGGTAGLDINIEMMTLGVEIPYGYYYVAVVLDCDDKVMESDEDNNICIYSDKIKLESPKEPDLKCKSLGKLWFDEWDISIKNARIANYGNGISGETTVCVYLSKDNIFGSATDILVDELPLKALGPGSSAYLSTSVQLMDLDIPYGEYYVGLVIDCGDKVAESDEYNNVCYYSEKIQLKKTDGPDLTCEDTGSMELKEAEGEGAQDPYELTLKDLKVKNIGTQKAEASHVGVYLSLDEQFGDQSDIYLGKMVIPAIDVDEIKTIDEATFGIDTSNIDEGSYFVGFVLDFEEKVDELDEGNNQCYHLGQTIEVKGDQLLHGCTCEYATATSICETFDRYAGDAMLAKQAGCWTTWSGKEDQSDAKEDAMVMKDHGFAATQALMIDKKDQNMLMKLGEWRDDMFSIKMKLFIPKNKMAYFGVKKYERTSSSSKCLEFTFGAEQNGKGWFEDLEREFTYPVDEWFDLEIVLDLRFYDKIQFIKVDGEVVVGTLRLKNNANLLLGALNFAAHTSQYKYMVDDILVERLSILPSGIADRGNVRLNAVDGGEEETSAHTAAPIQPEELNAPPAEASAATKQYTIYPNPTTGVFKIDMNLNSTQDVEVVIMNTMGQIVRRIRYDQVNEVKANIDLSDEPGGLYLIRTQVGDESYDTRLLLER